MEKNTITAQYCVDARILTYIPGCCIATSVCAQSVCNLIICNNIGEEMIYVSDNLCSRCSVP